MKWKVKRLLLLELFESAEVFWRGFPSSCDEAFLFIGSPTPTTKIKFTKRAVYRYDKDLVLLAVRVQGHQDLYGARRDSRERRQIKLR